MASSYADVKNPSTMDFELGDAEEALVCSDFTMSSAQQAYQRDAHRQDLAENEIMFYKDATPKAEHFMSFRAELPPRLARGLNGVDVPLDVELVALVPQPGGGVPTQRHYEPVADQSHLKALVVRTASGSADRPVAGATLAYRIELGSYRQGDRRFSILARVSPKAAADVPALRGLGPCLTPAVYVASKVKRHRTTPHEEEAEPPAKRHEAVATPPPPPDAATTEAVAQLGERLDRIERLLRQKIIPSLARIEQRAAGPPLPPMGGHHPPPPLPAQQQQQQSSIDFEATAETLFASPPLTLERGNSEQIINTFYAPDYAHHASDEVGGFWADSMTSMGNGLQEGMSASGLADAPPTAPTSTA